MLLTIFNVIYVLVAVAMIALILLQRGAGAQAGSGFGGGASATVFGARGAANFLTRSTSVLAGLFFLLSLAMGIYLHPTAAKSDNDLGVMSGYATPEPPKAPDAAAAPAKSDVPAATPAAPATKSGDTPAPTPAPAAASPDKATPAPAPVKKNDAKKSGGGKSAPEKN
jgi:preprotein translocase subunit SecG